MSVTKLPRYRMPKVAPVPARATISGISPATRPPKTTTSRTRTTGRVMSSARWTSLWACRPNSVSVSGPPATVIRPGAAAVAGGLPPDLGVGEGPAGQGDRAGGGGRDVRGDRARLVLGRGRGEGDVGEDGLPVGAGHRRGDPLDARHGPGLLQRRAGVG